MTADPIRIEAVKNHLVFEGVEYHQTDGLGEICRLLVERGVPLGTKVTIMRGETTCLVGDIHLRAERILKDTDKGFRMAKAIHSVKAYHDKETEA